MIIVRVPVWQAWGLISPGLYWIYFVDPLDGDPGTEFRRARTFPIGIAI